MGWLSGSLITHDVLQSLYWQNPLDAQTKVSYPRSCAASNPPAISVSATKLVRPSVSPVLKLSARLKRRLSSLDPWSRTGMGSEEKERFSSQWGVNESRLREGSFWFATWSWKENRDVSGSIEDPISKFDSLGSCGNADYKTWRLAGLKTRWKNWATHRSISLRPCI